MAMTVPHCYAEQPLGPLASPPHPHLSFSGLETRHPGAFSPGSRRQTCCSVSLGTLQEQVAPVHRLDGSCAQLGSHVNWHLPGDISQPLSLQTCWKPGIRVHVRRPLHVSQRL